MRDAHHRAAGATTRTPGNPGDGRGEAVPHETPISPGPDPNRLLTIGEMSRRTGLAVSALRFYEELGLISSTRTPGNQRRYPRHMLRRVSLLVVAKRLGIPLADVQDAFAELPADRAPSRESWERASQRWMRHLEARRQAIERLERELTGCIGCGCLSMQSCALLNPDDSLAEGGAGPRRLDPE